MRELNEICVIPEGMLARMRRLRADWKATEIMHETEDRPMMVMYYKGKIHAIDQLIEVLGEGV
tara:strand:+ start:45553 stop:45741 length:189 start_codon:yes stop_codon:yes gene_type:complete